MFEMDTNFVYQFGNGCFEFSPYINYCIVDLFMQQIGLYPHLSIKMIYLAQLYEIGQYRSLSLQMYSKTEI